MNNVDKNKLYSLEEAISLAVSKQRAKFVETLDISMKLGIDPTKPEQHVKGFIDLPNGTGIDRKILAIVKEDKIDSAKEAGADYAGEDFINKIKDGWLNFDVVVTSPDMMAKIGKVGKALGTKGLMPNVKFGNINKDIEESIKNFKNGRVIFKNDKYGLVNMPVGKSNFEHEKLLSNVRFLLKDIISKKPSTAKGQYLRSVSLSLTMGPSFKLDVVQLLKDLRS